eukprot:scaffold13236_cov82-Cyclotella_meneghiniana.AAC.1
MNLLGEPQDLLNIVSKVSPYVTPLAMIACSKMALWKVFVLEKWKTLVGEQGAAEGVCHGNYPAWLGNDHGMHTIDTDGTYSKMRGKLLYVDVHADTALEPVT